MSQGIGREFMKQTQYAYLDVPDQQKGLPQPPLELPYDESQPLIALPAPDALRVPSVDLRALITERRTVRRYAPQPLSLAELSYLLWCTQGVKSVEGGQTTRRTVPSAGARHALETYLLANRVASLEPGLYRYLALRHGLVAVDLAADVASRITAACRNQSHVSASAVTFIWTAVAYRMTWRYGERGYRYLHLDAGHVCQNLYLAAESIGCGVCALAAFDDAALNRELGVDGETQFAIYAATLGKKEA